MTDKQERQLDALWDKHVKEELGRKGIVLTDDGTVLSPFASELIFGSIELLKRSTVAHEKSSVSV